MTAPLPWRLTLRTLVLTVLLTGGGIPAAGSDHAAAAQGDRIDAIVDGMTRRQKVGQLFMSRIYGDRAEAPSEEATADNRRYLTVDDAAGLMRRFHVGSIVYFAWAGNLEGPTQIAGLSNGIQRAAVEAGDVPVMISTDQEHGIVQRVGRPATLFPGAMALGAARREGLARTAARVTGTELKALGIRQNLAPVADVNVNPANPVIGIRSFGSRARLVSRLTLAQVQGFERDAGIAATAKHFPGHGDTDIDSHSGLPTIRHSRSRWWALDAPPFQAAIDAGVDVVMTAHVAVPALDGSSRPATLSKPILTGILRERMGYEGVVMTDSLGMGALRDSYGDDRIAVLALKAGADILANPPRLRRSYDAVLDAIVSGELSMSRIETSVRRILRLKERLGLLDDPFVDVDAARGALGTAEHVVAAQRVADASITVLRDRGSWLPLCRGWRVLLTGWNDAGVRDLQRRLGMTGLTVHTRWPGRRPTRAQIDATVSSARRHDVTLVFTGYLSSDPQQRDLVSRLLSTDGRVIIVGIRSPYDAAWFSTAPAKVVTYGSMAVSMRALARVVAGRIKPVGKLPVHIPRRGAPGRTLFRFGSGLSW